MKRTILGNEPVTVDEAKEHIQGLEGIALHDTYISNLIKVAREQCEQFTWRCIVKSTFELRASSFTQKIIIPNPPLITIKSIKYFDGNGVEQTIDPKDYTALDWEEPGKLILNLLPSTRGLAGDITITYEAGYDEVPESFRHAILMMVRTWFDNREDVSNRTMNEMPMGSKFLLQSFRCNTF